MKWFHFLLTPFYLTSFIFASFSTSTTYELQSFSVGPGATNNSASTTYTVQGSTGEQQMALLQAQPILMATVRLILNR